jgi:3-hydroxybutyryl-CoA dehydratase
MFSPSPDALFRVGAKKMHELQKLGIGNRLPPRTYVVDQAIVNRYADVSGDHNPLHTDQDFAATTMFGRTIAHGMMTLCFLSDAMEVWAGESWSDAGELDVSFLAPVYPGDTVTVSLEVTGVQEGKLICEVECAVGDRKVVAGQASVPSASKDID